MAKKSAEEKVSQPKEEAEDIIKKHVARHVVVRGEWKDVIHKVDGSTEIVEGKIKPNQIQNGFSTILAAYCKGEAGFDRIGYIGIGEGLSSWDAATPAQPYDQSTLTTEYFRKAIDPANITFIDPDTDLSTGGTPSSKIEISVLLTTSEANGTLREFGLFGGEATIALDSGQIVNWVVHERIDKDTSLEIERIVRIEFVTR